MPGAASVDVTPSSQITPGTDTITILSGHGFTQNQAVTYHAPVRLKFLEEGVDVQLAPKSGVFVISRDDSGAINHSATANNIYLGTHGLGNGNIVQYTTDGVAIACTGGSDAGGQSGCVGGRLVNGGYYKVMFERIRASSSPISRRARRRAPRSTSSTGTALAAPTRSSALARSRSGRPTATPTGSRS